MCECMHECMAIEDLKQLGLAWRQGYVVWGLLLLVNYLSRLRMHPHNAMLALIFHT